ncbi:hypothetical protein UFOVP665_5 [uncultured Caudovirales phage]|uniref:Uncharacterized protein n=1 Tax=uncultured Caudovirales phage TaxID=2100421 RepID=A0A6J5NE25_9CAUD|nr:hypothetical protein UFOVP665_5 [uncultured Caudovirales phage]
MTLETTPSTTEWQECGRPVRFFFRAEPTSTVHYVLAWRVYHGTLRYMTVDGIDIATSSNLMMFAEVFIGGEWRRVS